jgi:predicted PurR-regulated permease PerM
MPMYSAGLQTRFWILASALFAVALWILKPVLLPFFAGMAIAYFLNPVVDRIEARGVPRWLCALMVLGGFALIITFMLLLIMPLLQGQIGALINAIPGYVEEVRAHFIPWIEGWLARFSPDDVRQIRGAAGEYIGNVASIAGKVLKDIITNSLAFIDVLALFIVTPVVAFYLMRDWPSVTRSLDSLIPRRHYETVKAELREIDLSLSGFVRGQALVCVALGFVYSVGLTTVGLQYGAAIGVVAGVLSFIPYVGTAFAWICSVILAFVQFGSLTRIGFVAGVLILGHVLEAYVLTPRLVGQRVGLHPVWILFALIAGVRLMGFTGVLVAVPVAAVAGVLIRFAIRRYKQSSLYEDPFAPGKP